MSLILDDAIDIRRVVYDEEAIAKRVRELGAKGVVKITKDIDIDISGKHVLVVEDVIRTGLTTAYLIQNLESKKPKDITLATMLLNPNRLLMTIPVKYYGFEIQDSWLLGYGLDAKEVGRNLPYIAELARKE